MKIMLDPGHAPGSPNHGPTGYFEYAGMWKLSNYLKDALERCGQIVGFTRTENEDKTLISRGECAKGYDVFISEHSNAGGGKGCEVYYSVRIPNDQGFASDLSAAVSIVLGDSSRGAKTWLSNNEPSYDYFTVMEYAVYAGCPHVFLCENGFHDNTEDEAQLKSDGKLKQIAEVQAKVICNHLGVAYYDCDTNNPSLLSSTTTIASIGFVIGDRVRIRDGVTTFADGVSMALFVRKALLYVRYLGEGKALVSTQEDDAITGWVKYSDLIHIDGSSAELIPISSKSSTAAETSKKLTPNIVVGSHIILNKTATKWATGEEIDSVKKGQEFVVQQVGNGKVLLAGVYSWAWVYDVTLISLT